jgi:hypothetical protein
MINVSNGWMLVGARMGDGHLMTRLEQQRNRYRSKIMGPTHEGDPHVMSLITAGRRRVPTGRHSGNFAKASLAQRKRLLDERRQDLRRDPDRRRRVRARVAVAAVG